MELHIFQKGIHGLSLAKLHTSGGLQHMISADVAKWFELCIAWLNQLFSPFTASEGYEQVKVLEYSVDVKLGLLWSNAASRQLLLRKLPSLTDIEKVPEAMDVPLHVILSHMKDVVSEQNVAELDKELKQVQVQG